MNAQDPEYLSFGSKLQKKMYVFWNVFNKDTKPLCQYWSLYQTVAFAKPLHPKYFNGPKIQMFADHVAKSLSSLII